MEQLTGRWSRFGDRPRLATVLGAVAVLAGSLLLAACDSEGPLSGPDADLAHRPSTLELSRPGSRGTTSVGAETEQAAGTEQVVAAWMAAQQAFESSARAPDPFEPELAATTVSPQIGWAESKLAQMRTDDEVALGPVRFGVPEVVAVSTGRATVSACAHDAEVVVSARTGRPVEGVDGRVENERFLSIMEWTDTGWKLANQVVGGVPCEPA
jgi:hypothetical protein